MPRCWAGGGPGEHVILRLACIWSRLLQEARREVLRLPAPRPGPSPPQGFTVPEVLTCPSAQGDQPTQTPSPPRPPPPPLALPPTQSRDGARKPEKAGLTFPGRAKNTEPLLPTSPQGPEPIQGLDISQALAPQLSPALQGQRGLDLCSAFTVVTGSGFLGQNSNLLLSGEKELSVGSQLEATSFPPLSPKV